MAVKILEPPSPGLSSPPAPGEGPAAPTTRHHDQLSSVLLADAVVMPISQSRRPDWGLERATKIFCSFFHQSATLARAARMIAYNIASQKIPRHWPFSISRWSVSVWSWACGQILCAPMPGCSRTAARVHFSGPDFLRAVMGDQAVGRPASS